MIKFFRFKALLYFFNGLVCLMIIFVSTTIIFSGCATKGYVKEKYAYMWHNFGHHEINIKDHEHNIQDIKNTLKLLMDYLQLEIKKSEPVESKEYIDKKELNK